MLAEEYLKRGYRVFCICHAQNQDTKPRINKGVEIFFIKNHLNAIMFEKRINSNTRFKRGFYYILQRFFSYFTTLETFFSFPVSKKMVQKYYLAIKKMCLEFDVSNIVVVNQPVEAVYSGMLIKKEFPRIKLITYLLDPINGNNKHKLLSESVCIERKKKIEKQVLAVSDIIIAQITHKDKLNYLPETIVNKIHYLGVPLLSNQIIQLQRKIKGTVNTLIYAGTTSNKYRPVAFIIKAIALSRNIRLKMYLTSGFEEAQKLVIKLKASNILINGPISRDLLLKEYEMADCLLNIGNTMEDQMPSKIFEYMSYGKPIISTYRIDNDTSKKIIEKYPVGLCIDERSVSSVKAVEQIEEFLSRDYVHIEFNKLKEIYSEYLPETFVDIVQ